MNKIKHLSIQFFDGMPIQSPLGVILSALAECEGKDITIHQKAVHIDNALAIFIQKGYSIGFCSDEESMLLFKQLPNKE